DRVSQARHAEYHAIAERAAAGPVAVREPLVDHDDAGGVAIVRLLERAPGDELDAHRLEVVGSGDRLVWRQERLAWSHHVSLGEDHARGGVAAERDVLGDGRGRDR